MEPITPREILARPGLEVVDGVALSAFLEAHRLLVRELHVVDAGDRARGIAERRMRGDVVYALRADVNDAPVAQRLEVFSPGFEHRSNESRAGCTRRGN